MEWKNWPSWLKGGIVALVIYIPLFLILNPYIIKQDPFNLIILEIPAAPILIVLPRVGIELGGLTGLTLLFFILLIYYFILGALIGFIISKIKSKKEET